MSTEQNYGGRANYATSTSQAVSSDQQAAQSTGQSAKHSSSFFEHYPIGPEESERTMVFEILQDTLTPRLRKDDTILVVKLEASEYHAVTDFVIVVHKDYPDLYRVGLVEQKTDTALCILRGRENKDLVWCIGWDEVAFLASIRCVIHRKVY